ncbi:hypothetical protein WOLCODRAFT_139927 [Wolfiporia cocos MD-104 SS10]|uniref:Uncharacterized protein n=1 Tax=Wolfiporia cocos (strain MD-104) TaxID=742152 RepID=A0A2H3IZY2_WOLCO|nr:hypothetical protein WOLCODRAFT_139927 [Wolfiporia cocos MD-104 SS10]
MDGAFAFDIARTAIPLHHTHSSLRSTTLTRSKKAVTLAEAEPPTLHLEVRHMGFSSSCHEPQQHQHQSASGRYCQCHSKPVEIVYPSALVIVFPKVTTIDARATSLTRKLSQQLSYDRTR